MAGHDAWTLGCRLFAAGTPVLRATLTPREAAALALLGKAIKPTTLDPQFVLCPHCQQHRAQVWDDGHGGRVCRCPDCGPVIVESCDGIDDLGDGVWRLGDARRSPVLLARDLTRVWQEPALLDRVAGGGWGHTGDHPQAAHDARIALRPWCGMACTGGALHVLRRWDRTRRHTITGRIADRRRSIHAGERAVLGGLQMGKTLPDGDDTPIRCTDGQARVFAALWSFKGEATTAERIMQRAGLDSAKPSDIFEVKPKDKGKPEPEAQHAAYGALVVTQQRAGLYWMPCAARALA